MENNTHILIEIFYAFGLFFLPIVLFWLYDMAGRMRHTVLIRICVALVTIQFIWSSSFVAKPVFIGMTQFSLSKTLLDCY